MGLGFGISRSKLDCDCKPKVVEERVLPNPDPANYKILHSESIYPYLIVIVQYPDCTNYEGKKILLFKDVKLADLEKQKLIDPHFSENKKYHSPIARFEPTSRGRKMAQVLAHSMLAFE